jgi:hypothetical protein
MRQVRGIDPLCSHSTDRDESANGKSTLVSEERVGAAMKYQGRTQSPSTSRATL